MNSRDAEKLYSGFLEGELSADEEEELRAFLAASPEAAADYRAFETAVELVRALPREEANEDMTDEIMSRVRRYRAGGERDAVTTERSRKRLARLMPLAAMLVLGFLTTLFFMRGAGGPGEIADEGAGVAAPAAVASGVLEDGEVPSAIAGERLDSQLRRVDGGSETPSIVF